MIEEFYIQSSFSEEAKLHVRIKSSGLSFNNPTILLHGRNLPPQYSYDFELSGKSAADVLSQNDITCIMPTCLGFGKSTKLSENRYEDWYRDIKDVISFLETTRGINKFNIVGWSSSSVPALMIASRMPEKINSVIIYGITKHYFVQGHVLEQKPFFFYNPDQLFFRRQKDIPADRKDEISPPEWIEKLKNEVNKLLPLKVPNGLENDRVDIVKGNKLMTDFITWENIKCPVLFTTGEWDTDCDTEGLPEYAKKCNGEVFLCPEGTHWVLMEKNRGVMIEKFVNFIKGSK